MNDEPLMTAARAYVGRGTKVHALLPGQVSYGRESACGYWYRIECLRTADGDVSCKSCLASSSVSENKDRQR